MPGIPAIRRRGPMETTTQETTVREVVRNVTRKASDAEIADAGRELVHQMQRRDEVESDFKQTKEAHKDALERVNNLVGAARATIEKAEVTEQVPCYVTFYPNEARAVVARQDSGLVLEERAMTPEELDAHRQLELAPAPDNVAAFPGESKDPAPDDNPLNAPEPVEEEDDDGETDEEHDADQGDEEEDEDDDQEF
jgi:hypothetical protein